MEGGKRNKSREKEQKTRERNLVKYIRLQNKEERKMLTAEVQKRRKKMRDF